MRERRLSLLLPLGWLIGETLLDQPRRAAEGTRGGSAAEQQKKFQEAVDSARTTEIISYIAIGVGVLVIVASIPIGIYWDRKKKARKDTAPTERLPADDAITDHGDQP